MIPDAECIRIISEALQSLDIGPYTIKLNHRLLLDGIFAACGVPSDKFRAVCSAIDKLDKNSWSEVRKEIIEEKGLNESSADKIGTYVSQFGGMELISKLREDNELMKNESAVKGLESVELLFKYCNILQVTDKIIFDLSLARGLDYYTGVIFEAILTGKDFLEGFPRCIKTLKKVSVNGIILQVTMLALVASRAVVVTTIWLECLITRTNRFPVSVCHWALSEFSTF